MYNAPVANKMTGKKEPERCPCGALLLKPLTKLGRCPHCNRRLEKMPDRKT